METHVNSWTGTSCSAVSKSKVFIWLMKSLTVFGARPEMTEKITKLIHRLGIIEQNQTKIGYGVLRLSHKWKNQKTALNW